MLPSLWSLTHTPLRGVLDILFPFHCAMCDAPLTERGLCGSCWGQLNFLSSCVCQKCSFPLPVLLDPADTPFSCLSCTANPPPFERALSVLHYDDASRGLMLRFKHGDELSLAPLFSQWLLEKGTPLWGGADLLIPVPLHWTRLLKRRFNQAAVLAQHLEKPTGVFYHPFILKKIHPTPSQGNLTFKQRHENVRGAFEIVPRHQPLLQGASVILIDDVYTTGATLKACTKTLLKGGASRVSVITLARVLRPETL